MNNNFVGWAIKVHAENSKTVEYWKKSPDIVEQALANAIVKATEDAKVSTEKESEHTGKTLREVARSRRLNV